MRIRVHRGNAELARAQPHRDLQHGQRMKGLLTSAKSPSALVGVGVYLAVNVTARVLARWKTFVGSTAWERDESARHAKGAS